MANKTNKLAKYVATNIKWDTDGEDVDDLPIKVTVEIPNDIVDEAEIMEFVSDEITNVTGFCHNGFVMKKVK